MLFIIIYLLLHITKSYCKQHSLLDAMTQRDNWQTHQISASCIYRIYYYFLFYACAFLYALCDYSLMSLNLKRIHIHICSESDQSCFFNQLHIPQRSRFIQTNVSRFLRIQLRSRLRTLIKGALLWLGVLDWQRLDWCWERELCSCPSRSCLPPSNAFSWFSFKLHMQIFDDTSSVSEGIYLKIYWLARIQF